MKELIQIFDNIGSVFSGTYHSNNNSFNDYRNELYDNFSHIPQYNEDKLNVNGDMRNVLGDLNKSVSLKK